MSAMFIYVLDALLGLALFAVIARLLLQLARADFRNPVCQGIVKVTNPLILPLRRVLPPLGKVDTASVFAVLLVATVKVGAQYWLADLPVLPPPLAWARAVGIEIARMLLTTYFYAIVLYAVLSMIAPGGYSPLQSLLATVCEPVLRPIRRVIPGISGLDLSPLWACIAIQALLILLR
jgi:YggT family protein